MSVMIDLMEGVLLPDAVIRRGIRRLLKLRLQDEYHGDTEVERQRQSQFFATLRSSPLAVETDAANDQHYELPPAFFAQVLGPRRKYSSCLYPIGVTGIAAAEEAMLAETCHRAGLADGMDILCPFGKAAQIRKISVNAHKKEDNLPIQQNVLRFVSDKNISGTII